MKRKFLKISVYAIILASTFLLIGIVTGIVNYSGTDRIAEENGMKFVSKVEGKNFCVYSNGKWENKFLKGVNLGAGKPGTFPGELAITKDEYLRWFKQISDMNADVIRVYTTLKPDFYDALYLYNKTARKPLYLLQGVWINEEDIAALNDAYGDNERIMKAFIKDAKDLVDVFHGNATLPKKTGFASGTYKSDISQYVIGWIFGVEWDPNFVNNTNKMNPTRNHYSGKYLFTENASPFETFMCEAGDKVVEYEAEKYKMIRPVSYSNWLTTDTLKHPNEPLPKEDMAEVNVEHIKPQKNFTQGVFASYHIYPYYPDFMNYQKEYVSFKDESGKINTYKAYLRDLMKQHTMPVLVAEFGIPASRGMAHKSLYSGYNQGSIDETQQGVILQSLLKDIYDEGYCGALVFSWQDEWFKRTWNTMDLDLPDSRPFWSNPQTNEQEFGLLAFDPGKKESVCYVDGDTQEWKDATPIYSGKNVKLFAKSDEKYLYLMADTNNFDFSKDKLLVPIDTINGQGNQEDKARNVKFSRNADFEVLIDGKDNSKVFVDAYYDSFNYIYAEQLKMLEGDPLYKVKNSGIFNTMYLCLNKQFILPQDKLEVPFSKYETGALKYGNGNPMQKEYNSLSDFCEKNGKIEIRIPWQLLNVMDPSSKSIMGDLYKNKGIKSEKTEGFYFGAEILGREEGTINMGYFTWKPWEIPTYHERLKPSYYKLQEAFGKIQ